MMRPMMPDDVDAAHAIEREVQRFPWTRGNFSDALCNGYLCRVDEAEGGRVRGYAILMLGVGEAELLNIGVARDEQRKGLGRMMLSEMLELAREKNMRRVFLEVRSSNTGAIALYRGAGFGEIGVRRGYYRNAGRSEDAVTMVCDISPARGSGGGEGAGG